MSRHACIQVSLLVGLLLAWMFPSADALAARRTVRVDFGGEWDTRQIGTADCPGSTVGSTLVLRDGITFSGRENAAHLVDDYCQISIDDAWNSSSFFQGDETGLAALVGPNTDNAVRAIRYSYLDDIRFDSPTGFQWGFYLFPNQVTIVALYGLEGTTLDATSYIRQAGGFLWRADLDGYDGEYFCFLGNLYLGPWSGDPAEPGSACMQALNTVFQDGFE